LCCNNTSAGSSTASSTSMTLWPAAAMIGL
jgi:hypothetical protein